jgi:hypothetical protein
VGAEASMPAVERSYLMPDGRLDMAALMAGFFKRAQRALNHSSNVT